MTRSSYIYRSPALYRAAMNLLYGGAYRRRFVPVFEAIEGDKVIEYCFGDTVLADLCRKNKIHWTGYDIQPVFVEAAKKKGYDARLADIRQLEPFPACDTAIICGSLYQFEPQLESLLTNLTNSSNRLLISEPVHNLSDRSGIIGKLAKASATVNGEAMEFRFNETALMTRLGNFAQANNYSLQVLGKFKKDILLLLKK